MSEWLSLLSRSAEMAQPVVHVAVANVLGSTPREPGACMLVGEHSLLGSIGGGRLEWEAIQAARTLLAGASTWQTLRMPLGPGLGQCCGGVVELWLERLEMSDRVQLAALWEQCAHAESEPVLATLAGAEGLRQRVALAETTADAGFSDPEIDRWVQTEATALRASSIGARLATLGENVLFLERLDTPDTTLFLFGAGHVGKALVPRLAGLPFDVLWVDSRANMFPDLLPANVRIVASLGPVEVVRQARAGAAFLVMTHSHALDYELCRAILLRQDACFVGLIGSHSKAARFAHRLARDGFPAESVGRLVCPIGIAGIDSKRPEGIATGVAAQLLRLREADWDGAGAHERVRRPTQRVEAPSQAVPIVVHRS